MDMWVVCTFCLFWIMCRYKILCGHIFKIPIWYYREVKLLCHMLILYLPFWETTKWFSTVAKWFYILFSSLITFLILHVLSTAYYFIFFQGLTVNVKWHLIVVWICILLMINNVEYFSYTFWQSVCIFREMLVQLFFPCFNQDVCTFVILW